MAIYSFFKFYFLERTIEINNDQMMNILSKKTILFIKLRLIKCIPQKKNLAGFLKKPARKASRGFISREVSQKTARTASRGNRKSSRGQFLARTFFTGLFLINIFYILHTNFSMFSNYCFFLLFARKTFIFL